MVNLKGQRQAAEAFVLFATTGRSALGLILGTSGLSFEAAALGGLWLWAAVSESRQVLPNSGKLLYCKLAALLFLRLDCILQTANTPLHMHSGQVLAHCPALSGKHGSCGYQTRPADSLGLAVGALALPWTFAGLASAAEQHTTDSGVGPATDEGLCEQTDSCSSMHFPSSSFAASVMRLRLLFCSNSWPALVHSGLKVAGWAVFGLRSTVTASVAMIVVANMCSPRQPPAKQLEGVGTGQAAGPAEEVRATLARATGKTAQHPCGLL